MVTIKPNYAQGLSEQTKDLMKSRDYVRSQLKHQQMSSTERKAITIKYRKLRNQATAQIKTDKKKANSERINKAKSESEIWKVIADITKPNSLKTITLNENNVLITDEKTVANTLNKVSRCHGSVIFIRSSD